MMSEVRKKPVSCLAAFSLTTMERESLLVILSALAPHSSADSEKADRTCVCFQ